MICEELVEHKEREKMESHEGAGEEAESMGRMRVLEHTLQRREEKRFLWVEKGKENALA